MSLISFRYLTDLGVRIYPFLERIFKRKKEFWKLNVNKELYYLFSGFELKKIRNLRIKSNFSIFYKFTPIRYILQKGIDLDVIEILCQANSILATLETRRAKSKLIWILFDRSISIILDILSGFSLISPILITTFFKLW